MKFYFLYLLFFFVFKTHKILGLRRDKRERLMWMIKYLMMIYKICEKNLIRNKYLTDEARRSPDTDTVLWSCCWSEIFQSKSCPGRTWLPPPLLTTESLNIWVLMNFGLLFASWLGCKISGQNYISSDHQKFVSEIPYNNNFNWCFQIGISCWPFCNFVNQTCESSSPNDRLIYVMTSLGFIM